MKLPLLLAAGCIVGFAAVHATEPTPGRAPFVVAALKLIPQPGDKAGNYAKFERAAREAAAAGAQLLVTSECYLDGYLGNTRRNPGMTRAKLLEVAETLDGPHVRRAAALAAELKVHVIFNFSERRADQVYTTAAVLTPDGGVAGTYSKSHLEPTEFYSPGTEFPVFATEFGRIGLLICYDRQLPETSRLLALQGAELVIVPAHSEQVDLINEDLMVRVRAYENNVFMLLHSPFNSLAADPDGELIAHNGDRTAEGIVYSRIDLSRRHADGGPIARRRPELYQPLTRPPVPPSSFPP